MTFLHSPSKALRAAATAMSTSFSVASWTEQITSSVAGLMTSKVWPSTPLTNSLLMKLRAGRGQLGDGLNRVNGTYRPVGCSYLPVCGVWRVVEVMVGED